MPSDVSKSRLGRLGRLRPCLDGTERIDFKSVSGEQAQTDELLSDGLFIWRLRLNLYAFLAIRSAVKKQGLILKTNPHQFYLQIQFNLLAEPLTCASHHRQTYPRKPVM